MFGVIRTTVGRQLTRQFQSSPVTYFASKIEVGDPEVQKEIKEIVSKDKLVVFMKGDREAPKCGFSNAVVQILRMHDVKEYKDVDVLDSEKLRQGIKDFSKWPTIPQVFINGEFVGGCDIMIQMHRSGELQQALEKAGIEHSAPEPQKKKDEADDEDAEEKAPKPKNEAGSAR